MENPSRIIVIANPGHFRDSLVAVLMTLPRVDLFLVNPQDGEDFEVALHHSGSLVLTDRVGPDQNGAGYLAAIKKSCPGVRCLALVDTMHQSKAAQELGADYVLPRSASARELLSAVRRMNACASHSFILGEPFRAPAFP